MKDKKSMAMIIIVGIIVSLFLFVNTTVFATTGTVLTSDLRLRKEENTSSEVLDLLDENDKVEIISQNGDWYKVKANGKVGYVSKQYIKVKEETPVLNNQAEDTNTQKTSNETTNEVNNKNEEQASESNTETSKQEEQKSQEQPKTGKFSSEVELKLVPLISGAVVNSAKTDEKYDIISTVGLWSYVTSSTKSGWVLTEKITITDSETKNENTEQDKPSEKTEEQSNTNNEQTSTEKMYSSARTYYVKGSSVNARSEANKNSSVVKVLNTNNSVKVTGEDGDWYIVDLNGKKAYVSKSLLSKEKVEVTSRSSTSLDEANRSVQVTTQSTATESTPVQEQASAPVASNPSGSAIVAYAKTFLGYRYVYGTNGPNTFDCSGFVQYVYKHFGYSLSRSSSTQANDGVAVSKSDLQPGDVLIFRDTSNSRIGHVGLYIGDGQFIHASNSRTGVIISSLSSSAYQTRYVCARRIL